MFSIFNPKRSPLMLDAKSLNFLLQEKTRILERKIQEIAVRAAVVLCPSHDQRTGLANCFAAFLPSQVFVACYHPGLCSLQWPFLQDGVKPSDTGLQGAQGPC